MFHTQQHSFYLPQPTPMTKTYKYKEKYYKLTRAKKDINAELLADWGLVWWAMVIWLICWIVIATSVVVYIFTS